MPPVPARGTGSSRSSIWSWWLAHSAWALAVTPSAANRPMSSGWMTWMCAMCGRVSVAAVDPPCRLDGVERLAHRAFADGVDVHLEPECVESRDVAAERVGVDHAQAAVRGREAVEVEVRLEDGRGAVLEDPVLHQLHARRAVAIRRGACPALDELLDLSGTTRRGPTTTPRRPARSARRDRPASCRRSPRRSGVTMASCQWVMPRRWSSAWASRRASTSSSGLVAGRSRSTREAAPSWSAPGRPAVGVALDPSVGRVETVGGDAGEHRAPGR